MFLGLRKHGLWQLPRMSTKNLTQPKYNMRKDRRYSPTRNQIKILRIDFSLSGCDPHVGKLSWVTAVRLSILISAQYFSGQDSGRPKFASHIDHKIPIKTGYHGHKGEHSKYGEGDVLNWRMELTVTYGSRLREELFKALMASAKLC